MTSTFYNQICMELQTTGALKATGENFASWKEKLDLVLVELSAKYVLTDPFPQVLNNGSSQQEVEAFDNWIYYDQLCRQIIMDTIDYELSPFLYHLQSAASFMDALEARFKTTPAQKIQLLRRYIGQKMPQYSPIEPHVNILSETTFDLENAGFMVPEEMKLEVLKNSLSASWKDTMEGMIAGMDKEGAKFNTVVERLRGLGVKRASGKEKNTYGDQQMSIMNGKSSFILAAFLCFCVFLVCIVIVRV